MSTIGSLLALMDPGVKPYNEQELIANRIQFGNTQNQTQLLELADLRRQQEEAAMARQFMQANPGQMLPGGGGGPLLASPALTAGGGGPMTQQTVVPGQPPGAPQPVPGGQDLSQFATGGGPPGGMPGGPPQSTLGSLAPQQDSFEARMQALMAQSPGAALQVMQTRMKLQEQQLTWGLKSIEAVAQLTHGVKTQEDLDRVRAQMQQIAPQAAAQLPQFYSAEALEAFQEKALGVKERQTLKIQDVQAQAQNLQAQAEAMKVRLSAQQQAGAVPKYTEDSTLNVAIDTLMQQAGLPRGTPPPQHILAQAQKNVQQGKVDVSAAQSENAARIAANVERTEKPLEGEAAKAVSDLTTLRTMTDDLAKLYKPEYAGWQNRLGLGTARETIGAMDAQETSFRSTALDIQDMLGRLRTGAVINPAEMRNLERLAPGPTTAPELFLPQLQRFQRALEQTRESRLRVGTTGRAQLREETTPTTPRVGEPPTGTSGQAPTGGKVASEADITATMQASGKTRQQVLDALKAKGYTVR